MSPATRQPKPGTLQFYKTRLLLVLVHIQSRLDEPLELEALARLAGFSPFHFHRVFRGMVGETLQAHIRRLRLERAALRLAHSRRPVVDIAFEAGYETHEAFTRAFRTAFGASPSAYRASRGSLPLPRARSGVRYAPDTPPRDFRTLNQEIQRMNVSTIQLQPTRVAFVRHVGPYAGCGAAWERLCAWAGKEGLLGAGCRFIGICYDDPEVTPPERVRYDACVTVDASERGEGDIGVLVLPGGLYARTTHQGPYEGLSGTYAKMLGQWLPRNGWQVRDQPSLEFYLNDPGSTEPSELLTDVHVPIARA